MQFKQHLTRWSLREYLLLLLLLQFKYMHINIIAFNSVCYLYNRVTHYIVIDRRDTETFDKRFRNGCLIQLKIDISNIKWLTLCLSIRLSVTLFFAILTLLYSNCICFSFPVFSIVFQSLVFLIFFFGWYFNVYFLDF